MPKINNRKGFKLICQECGNEVELKDRFNRSELSIYLSSDSWGDVFIECEKCDKNEIDSR